MEKVSIIVPVYNVEKYLRECLDSIINQTYSNIEIICVNDGSTDASSSILKEYSKKDRRIIIVNKANGGLLAARLDGLKRATGKYVLNIDSDDYINNNTIELLLGYLQKYNTDVVRFCYDDSVAIAPHTPLLLGKRHFEPRFFDALYGSHTLNSAVLNFFRRDIFKVSRSTDTTISLGEDLEYNLSLYQNMKSILIINEKLYHYRKNSGSITRKKSLENIFQNIESAHKIYTHLFESVNTFSIKDVPRYHRIAATRYITEIYYLELKLLSALNKQNRMLIENEIATTHERLENKGFVGLSNTKLIKQYSRGHTIYLTAMYRNHLRSATFYARTFYRIGLIIRSIIK